MIEKENVVLEAGNSLLDGGTHRSLPAASLGPSVRTRTLQEQSMLHEVEGHVRKRHRLRQLSSARRHHWQRPGRWEFGEHEPFGEVCGVGVAPVQHPLLLEPAAARASCSMVQNSKDYFATGQRGADGERAVASATTSILRKAPKKKNAPHPLNIVNRSVRTLAAHTGPSRPKDATWPRRHGKFFHLRHGREGLGLHG